MHAVWIPAAEIPCTYTHLNQRLCLVKSPALLLSPIAPFEQPLVVLTELLLGLVPVLRPPSDVPRQAGLQAPAIAASSMAKYPSTDVPSVSLGLQVLCLYVYLCVLSLPIITLDAPATVSGLQLPLALHAATLPILPNRKGVAVVDNLLLRYAHVRTLGQLCVEVDDLTCRWLRSAPTWLKMDRCCGWLSVPSNMGLATDALLLLSPSRDWPALAAHGGSNGAAEHAHSRSNRWWWVVEEGAARKSAARLYAVVAGPVQADLVLRPQG